MTEVTEIEQKLLDTLRDEYWPHQQAALPVQAAAAKFPNAKKDVSVFNDALFGLQEKGYIEQRGIQIVLTDNGLRKIGARPPACGDDDQT